MIYGIGIDLVEPERIAALLARYGDRFLQRVLTPLERAGYERAGQPALFVANRFAAKEAFSKAMGTGLRHPVTLQNISVVPDGAGKPGFSFAPELEQAVRERHIVGHHLSLTHERTMTCACVVLEQGEIKR